MAVSGDTAVIGAWREASNATTVNGDGSNNSAFASGAAYVFTRSGSSWSQQAYLKANNSGADDNFGYSVAVSGDTAVIGANQEDSNATTVDGDGSNNSATGSGAAYVFTRSGTTWSQQAYLKANDSFPFNVGTSVAVSSDTAVIGSRISAYIFTRSSMGIWSQQTSLNPSNSESGDEFGISVALSGDTAVIGAYGEDSNATTVDGDGSNNSAPNSGAAYVFARNSGIWSQQAYLKASNSEENDFFGGSVTVSGDTAVIGASNEWSNAAGVNGNGSNNSAPGSGAAYVFTRSMGVWSQQAYLKASNSEPGLSFGRSVAVSGDSAIVGAPNEGSNARGVGGNQSNNSLSGAGAAYAFTGLSPALTPPTVTSLSPTNGTSAGGTTVTLTGTYFIDAIRVTFDGVAATSVKVVDATTLTCTTPPGTAGTASVVVTNPFGTNAPNSLFTYTAPIIQIKGNNTLIANADTTPRISDHTDFGNAAVSTQLTRTFTITNNGDLTLNLTGSPIVGLTADTSFAVTAQPDSTLAPGASTAFDITFNPTLPGKRTAFVTIPNDDLNAPSFTFAITGEGIQPGTAPVIQISGNTQPIANTDTTPSTDNHTDFGNAVLPNSRVTRTFTLANTGSAPLYLTSQDLVAITGPNASDFTVINQPNPSVPVGASTTFAITFDPNLPGARNATVTIPNTAAVDATYTFSISGFGALSTLKAQTITFAPPATVYLSQSPLNLVATASSGLPVTLTVVSGTATLVGNSLTFTTAGTVRITATQSGGSNFAAAPSITRTLTIKADPPTLTLINLTQTYDGNQKPIDTIGGTPPVTINYKIGTLTGPTAPTNAGSYPVTAVAGGVTKTGTLVIAKSVLTVTPDNQRKFAGQDNPPLTASITGFHGGDDKDDLSKVPVLKTTATATSVGGTYPITASGALDENYTFIYQPGTLVVEGFAGSYEALLAHATSPLPIGKLSITVPASSRTFTARLSTGATTSAVSFSGLLTTDGTAETATGNATTNITINKVVTPYGISFTFPLTGDVTASATRADAELGSATNGRKLLALPKGAVVNYAGAHTAVLEPATPSATNVPVGAGWATATISTSGAMTLAGRLGDGTPFTTTLSPDTDTNPTYRLFIQPYLPARTESYLAGAFTLTPHPNPAPNSSLTTRRYVSDADLTWKKTGLLTDTSYRTTFGPVNTVLMLDPWLPPVAAKGVVPAITLAQRLGSIVTPINSFGVTHSETGSEAQGNLPTRLALSPTNAVSVTDPSANTTKWKTLTFNATTGTFTGSFELLDGLAKLKRPVTFSGVLRQPANILEELIGNGHYLLPPLSGTERTTGEIRFTRP